MLRRDRHLALVLGGMLALNVLTALASVSAVYVYRRRFRLLVDVTTSSVKASEKASIEAASNALLLADLVKDGGGRVEPDGSFVSPPRVVGYGQTRSCKSIWIYRDVEQDGVVHREFVERIPFAK